MKVFIALLWAGLLALDNTVDFVFAMSPPKGSAASVVSSQNVDNEGEEMDYAAIKANGAFRLMHHVISSKVNNGAFLAALDQSGGSTPKALQAYGMGPEEGNYEVGTESMFDAVHSMRSRIMTSPCFKDDRVLGAILFEDTMDRTVEDIPTCEYLWVMKGIVPFLKIDKGLSNKVAKVDSESGGIEIIEGEASVQLLNPIPNLQSLLRRAKAAGVYGTKARSLILDPKHPEQIDALVQQQFEIAREVLKEGLIPIIEPEIDVSQDAADKQACEEILCRALLRELDALEKEGSLVTKEDSGDSVDAKTLLGQDNHQVMIKISLPEIPNQYQECVDHPCCLRVVALSGGYDQTEANARLSRNRGIVASFSRALAEGLSHGMTEEEFESKLSESLDRIFEASSPSSASP